MENNTLPASASIPRTSVNIPAVPSIENGKKDWRMKNVLPLICIFSVAVLLMVLVCLIRSKYLIRRSPNAIGVVVEPSQGQTDKITDGNMQASGPLETEATKSTLKERLHHLGRAESALSRDSNISSGTPNNDRGLTPLPQGSNTNLVPASFGNDFIVVVKSKAEEDICKYRHNNLNSECNSEMVKDNIISCDQKTNVDTVKDNLKDIEGNQADFNQKNSPAKSMQGEDVGGKIVPLEAWRPSKSSDPLFLASIAWHQRRKSTPISAPELSTIRAKQLLDPIEPTLKEKSKKTRKNSRNRKASSNKKTKTNVDPI